jgi:hypothetical protein
VPQLPLIRGLADSFQLPRWKSILDPLLAAPASDAQLLSSISLVNGTTVVNHKLGRALKGWMVVLNSTAGTDIYDSQDTNPSPDKTLILNSSAAAVVSLLVF